MFEKLYNITVWELLDRTMMAMLTDEELKILLQENKIKSYEEISGVNFPSWKRFLNDLHVIKPKSET